MGGVVIRQMLFLLSRSRGFQTMFCSVGRPSQGKDGVAEAGGSPSPLRPQSEPIYLIKTLEKKTLHQ